MTELISTIYTILNAETGEDEVLEGVKILRDMHEKLTDLICGIVPDREETVAQSGPFKCVLGRVHLYVGVNVPAKAADEKSWYNARVSAESYGRIIERVLLLNPRLVTTVYPNGFTSEYEETSVTEKDYNHRIIGADRFEVVRLTLQVKYIYRNGVIALS